MEKSLYESVLYSAIPQFHNENTLSAFLYTCSARAWPPCRHETTLPMLRLSTAISLHGSDPLNPQVAGRESRSQSKVSLGAHLSTTPCLVRSEGLAPVKERYTQSEKGTDRASRGMLLLACKMIEEEPVLAP